MKSVGVMAVLTMFVVGATVAVAEGQAGPVDPLLVESIGFYLGSGGSVDDVRAKELLLAAAAFLMATAYWYRKAAEKGDALPMFWLGENDERGEGVERDIEQARHWYGESARRGRADARAALERLSG